MVILTDEEIARMSGKERRAQIIDILTDGLLEWLKHNLPPDKRRKGKPARAEKADIEALRKSVEEAKANLDKMQAMVKEAKNNYRKALKSFLDTCRKAGIAYYEFDEDS
ncbi:MAG: hypothetical protein A2V67_18025 [Deltaproteobacteria bacterium RBG_13_61_14]|nr:MAG: hypothetical protein A2V67_18025 [Deltaproteobacteria bacterium RBG_13_61_14]